MVTLVWLFSSSHNRYDPEHRLVWQDPLLFKWVHNFDSSENAFLHCIVQYVNMWKRHQLRFMKASQLCHRYEHWAGSCPHWYQHWLQQPTWHWLINLFFFLRQLKIIFWLMKKFSVGGDLPFSRASGWLPPFPSRGRVTSTSNPPEHHPSLFLLSENVACISGAEHHLLSGNIFS